tara:strand:+ start:754 stop:1083 length:330 start_codon:yes stop_codon:yes gene_type:complete
MSTDYGNICSSKTGESIRPATEDEWLASMEATLDDGGHGAFDADDDGTCYVDGPGVRCVSDRYDADGSTPYDSPHDFVAMVASVFGQDVDLALRADGWHDSRGLVLVHA